MLPEFYPTRLPARIALTRSRDIDPLRDRASPWPWAPWSGLLGDAGCIVAKAVAREVCNGRTHRQLVLTHPCVAPCEVPAKEINFVGARKVSSCIEAAATMERPVIAACRCPTE